jgi:hypothetical protein
MDRTNALKEKKAACPKEMNPAPHENPAQKKISGTLPAKKKRDHHAPLPSSLHIFRRATAPDIHLPSKIVISRNG